MTHCVRSKVTSHGPWLRLSPFSPVCWNFPEYAGIASGHLIAALGTELAAAFHCSTAPPALVLRPQRLAALRTELRPLCARAAGRTKRRSFGGQVHTLGQVHLLKLLLHLVDLSVHLGAGEFGLDVRRAVVAELALLVPAGRLAYPVRALGTLAEVRLRLFHRGAERRIVAAPLHRALNLVRVAAHAPQKATEQVAHCAHGAAGHAHRRGLELRHEPVAAPVAKELELVAAVRRVIRVV